MRKILKKIINEKKLKKYEKLVDKGTIVLFLMCLLPLFPDDELNYLIGLSKMKAKTYIPIMVVGHSGGLLTLAYIGNGVSFKNPLLYVLLTGALIAGLLLIYYSRKQFFSKKPKEQL